MKEIHDYLRELRVELGYTQETMADLCGISQPTYNRIENGKKKIDMEDIEKIAKATAKTKHEVMQRLNGMTVKNTINNAHDNTNVVQISSDEWFKLLIEEKDKRLLEKETIIVDKNKYIDTLEEKLRNLGLL